MIFETVFSAFDKIDFLILTKKGYFIRFFFVGTNHPSINANHITHRVLKGGHDVPLTKIISRYRKSILNFCFISNLVNRWYVYDNSEDYVEAKLLFRASNEELEKKYCEINDWSSPIFDSIKQPKI